jgi:ABC-type phosphate transport system substrate-binding protein
LFSLCSWRDYPQPGWAAQQKTAGMLSRRRMWMLIRIAVYLVVILGIMLYRGGVPFKRFRSALRSAGNEHPTLVLAGRDIAPPLVEKLAAEYRRDYPKLQVTVLPGGTYRALDQLLARETDVAFLMRRPTAAEQALFRQADGDTAVTEAIGLGGLVLLAGAQASIGPVTLDALKAALAPASEGGAPGAGLAALCGRFYAPDPNEGAWDALLGALGLPISDVADTSGTKSGPVVFLADAAAVIAAVAADPGSWGVVSTLNAGLEPELGPPAGTRFVEVTAAGGVKATSPTAANIGTGAYPLNHSLYVACRGAGGLEGVKFVNHLGSARGLRQVENAGVLPARLVAREIQLSRDAVGKGGK